MEQAIEYEVRFAEGQARIRALLGDVEIGRLTYDCDPHDVTDGSEIVVVILHHDYAINAGLETEAVYAVEAELLRRQRELRADRRVADAVVRSLGLGESRKAVA